jgi:hypothetical protein
MSASEGIATYLGRAKGSHPTAGTKDEVTKVLSVRLEFVIPRDEALLESVLMVGIIPNDTHPWEEPVVIVEEAKTSVRNPLWSVAERLAHS